MAAHKLGFPRLLLLFAALTPLSLAQTTVTLTSSPNPSPFGAPVNLTATVTPSNATGRITFYDGANVLGTRTLASGTASPSTTLIPIGIRKLRAYYAGDASHAATSGGLIHTVISQPTGGFTAKSPITTPVNKVFAIGDFNGDGKADLVFNDGTPFTIGVLLGNGNGTFQPPLSLTFPSPAFAAAADFNGDGKADLVVLDGEGNISIVQGNGDGTFQAAIATGSTASTLAIGDFNGDSKPDLATASGAGVNILLGKGDGT